MIKSREGTLLGYFREFLKIKGDSDWWTQPEFMAFANRRVVEDGGVEWWNKKHGGYKKGKKNPDGSCAIFGDGGRCIEQFRTEKWEGCFDNKTGTDQGPFKLNIEKYKNYKGSTKTHSFNAQIKKAVAKRSNGRCELCGHKGRTEIDHFVPKEKGGLSTIENANALCRRCNDRKCNKTPQVFMTEELERMTKYFEERGMKNELMNWLSEYINHGAK